MLAMPVSNYTHPMGYSVMGEPAEVLGQDDVEPTPEGGVDVQAERKRQLLIFGAGGVAVGALGSGLMTGLAFKAHKASGGSSVSPALVAGIGSFAVGGLTLLMLSRGVGGTGIDNRVLASVLGFQLAR